MYCLLRSLHLDFLAQFKEFDYPPWLMKNAVFIVSKLRLTPTQGEYP